jgi:hypothetical protein
MGPIEEDCRASTSPTRMAEASSFGKMQLVLVD